MVVHHHNHYLVEDFKFATLLVVVRFDAGIEVDVESCGEDDSLDLAERVEIQNYWDEHEDNPP